jgi:hypothetical protein
MPAELKNRSGEKSAHQLSEIQRNLDGKESIKAVRYMKLQCRCLGCCPRKKIKRPAEDCAATGRKPGLLSRPQKLEV